MTINDIAKLAGVSKATISRYLNNGYISSEKRQIVEKVIKETGFSPSSQARTLRTKRTDVIGVIIPKLSSESIARMVDGIAIELKKNSYKILLADTINNEAEELVYLKTMQSYKVDGIILFGTVITEEHEKVMSECKVPLVILGQDISKQNSIYFDDFSASKELSTAEKSKSVKILPLPEKPYKVTMKTAFLKAAAI